MSAPTDTLEVHINGRHTFFVSERVVSKYSSKLRKLIKQERRQQRIDIHDFPGGADGFELVSRFSYGGGSISITVSNVAVLRCSAAFLEMDEESSKVNLLHQTEVFLEGIFYWSWSDILTCLKSCCEPFLHSSAESCGLIHKLISSLIAKISHNSDANLLSGGASPSPSSSSSSSCNNNNNSSDNNAPSPGRSKSQASCWWFKDLTALSPVIIEQFLRSLGSYGGENDSLVLTRFLLHYLKVSKKLGPRDQYRQRCAGLAETAIHGVVTNSSARGAFSCRGLLWILRTVNGYGICRESKMSLEMVIAKVLDRATLDDLLVSGGDGGFYDVGLVLRLIRLFVHYNDRLSLQKMKRVGFLVDMYLVEIGPDPVLKLSKFVGVAEALPDCARDSYDRVYRAVDIYLQSHPCLPMQERSRLCRCLNLEKLSLETCKDLAKNPRIPPRVSVQALASQHKLNITTNDAEENDHIAPSPRRRSKKIDGGTSGDRRLEMVLYSKDCSENESFSCDEKLLLPEDMKMNLEGMQWRVVELEKVCREMKGHIAKINKVGPHYDRPLPRLC